MDRDEIWVEDLGWIEADEALDDLESVLVVFDEYGSVLTVVDGAASISLPPSRGFRRIRAAASSRIS
jgi:hypothetical protein